MKKYQATVSVTAKPMSRQEYNDYRGWVVPADENPSDPGFLVRLSSDHESWLPEAEFKAHYSSAESHVDRMLIEKEALESKIKGLANFAKTPAFGSLAIREQKLMLEQHQAMNDYSWLLGQRIRIAQEG